MHSFARLRNIRSQVEDSQMRDLTRNMTLTCLAVSVCLVSSLVQSQELGTGSDIVSFKSPKQLASVLEKRWTVDGIKRFCVPETRFNPFERNLSVSRGEVWHGFLHIPAESKVGKVYWHAFVKNGRVDRLSVNVVRNNDHWHLETLRRMPEVFDRLDTKQVIERRVVAAIAISINAYRWGASSRQQAGKDWLLHYGLYNNNIPTYTNDTFEYAARGNTYPTKYTRRVQIDFPGEPIHELVVLFGKDAMPTKFLLDGKSDEYMEMVYSKYVREYSRWLNTLVCGYERASSSSSISWNAHLEALGLSEECARFLRKHPLAAGVKARTSNRYRKSNGVSQPDYQAWRKITNGMTEAEVFSILGPPEQKGMRSILGGYEWRYGTVVPKSQVIPRPYEFYISFFLGRVDGKEDPFGGQFSPNGLPSTTRLVHPRDGEVFANNPGFVDLRWCPSSGQYPMHYEIELSNSSSTATAKEPYTSITVRWDSVVSWRVRAVNALGKSDWSESRTFKGRGMPDQQDLTTDKKGTCFPQNSGDNGIE